MQRMFITMQFSKQSQIFDLPCRSPSIVNQIHSVIKYYSNKEKNKWLIHRDGIYFQVYANYYGGSCLFHRTFLCHSVVVPSYLAKGAKFRKMQWMSPSLPGRDLVFVLLSIAQSSVGKSLSWLLRILRLVLCCVIKGSAQALSLHPHNFFLCFRIVYTLYYLSLFNK